LTIRPLTIRPLTALPKQLSTLLKITVTAAGLYYALSQAPLAEVGQILARIAWPWFILAFALVNVGLVVRAFRWLLLLRGLGIGVPLPRLVAIYFVGSFFNTFLPSGFGGDVVRVLVLGKNIARSTAAGTVLVDRLTGLLMLFVMALVALPVQAAGLPTNLIRGVIGICTLGLLGGLVLLSPRLMSLAAEWFGRWLPQALSPTGNGAVARVWTAVQGSGQPAIRGALAISIIFNLILVGVWTAAGHALGFAVPYTYYLLVVPILSVTLLAPSIGGLGVRESVAPLLFTAAGLTPTEAVALSLLEFTLVRLTGLIGGPVYMMMRNDR
jgi:glycosyltransferase 2 family protein